MAWKLVPQGPEVPPSEDMTKRDARWNEDMHVAQGYMWGRMDAGESHRSVNRNFDFCEKWADAQWRFRREERVSLPTMAGALAKHDAGEDI